MPNICDFRILSSGEPAQLFSLQSLLERGRAGLTSRGYVILEFERLFPDDVVGRNESGQTLMVPDLYHKYLLIFDMGGPPMARFEDGSLWLGGQSKWDSPIRFMARLSKIFPGLEFFLQGCIEHARREIWRAAKGLVWPVEDYVDDSSFDGCGETNTWIIRDSVELDTGKFYMPVDILAVRDEDHPSGFDREDTGNLRAISPWIIEAWEKAGAQFDPGSNDFSIHPSKKESIRLLPPPDAPFGITLGDVGGYNSTADEDLEPLAGLTQLARLNLNGSKVTDDGLRHLGHLANLEQLHLSRTGVSDRGLALISHLQRLLWISLRGTRVTDTGLDHLTKLEMLEGLNLHETKVEGHGLNSLRRNGKLEVLLLGRTGVTDDALQGIGDLFPRLQFLDLIATRVSDAAMVEVGRLEGIERLWLAGTAVGDAGIIRLGGLKKLISLDLGGTRVTTGGLMALARLGSLVRLDLSRTGIPLEDRQGPRDALP
jgi:hypothetical protein